MNKFQVVPLILILGTLTSLATVWAVVSIFDGVECAELRAYDAPPMRPEDQFSLGDRTLLDPPTIPVACSGRRTTVTRALTAYTTTVRVDERDLGLRLDETYIECHGGVATVSWYVGNLEPTIARSGIHLTVHMDDIPISSILVGSTRGIWNDAPTSIVAAVPCPAGDHLLYVEIEAVSGEWGIPYAANPGAEAPDLRINRGFVISEVW